MKLEDSHPGIKGKTLAEKMRDKTDEMFAEWMSAPQADTTFGMSKQDIEEAIDNAVKQGRIEGACDMMAILTSTKSDLQWDSVEARYYEAARRDRRRHAHQFSQ